MGQGTCAAVQQPPPHAVCYICNILPTAVMIHSLRIAYKSAAGLMHLPWLVQRHAAASRLQKPLLGSAESHTMVQEASSELMHSHERLPIGSENRKIGSIKARAFTICMWEVMATCSNCPLPSSPTCFVRASSNVMPVTADSVSMVRQLRQLVIEVGLT